MTDVSTQIARAAAPIRHGPRERIGNALGHWLAPAVARISRFRRARMVHARGITFTGRSEAIIGGAYATLGAQLDGRVLARCSGALWGKSGIFDLLGIALRFRPGYGPALDEHPALGDQDLMFATARSPFTVIPAMLSTDPRDFMANTYFGISPFAVHDHDRIELRLEPIASPMKLHDSRDDRLRRAVAAGHAEWWLEARKTLTLDWHAVARVTFEREAVLDDDALHFDPERMGCGIVPVGLVHAIRRATYDAGYAAR